MIRPTKYMDLDVSVVRVAATILSELQKVSAIPLGEIDEIVRARVGELARFNFVPAINLLYLLGSLEYDEDSDSLVSASIYV